MIASTKPNHVEADMLVNVALMKAKIKIIKPRWRGVVAKGKQKQMASIEEKISARSIYKVKE